MGNNHCDLAGNTGKKYICFGCGVIPGFTACYTHVGFKVIDCTFHNGTDFVKGDPVIRIPLDAGEHAEVHVLIGVSGASFFSSTARLFAVADPFPFDHMDFGADPFIPAGTSLFMAVSSEFHIKGIIFGAGGIAVYVVADFFKSAFVPWVIGDKSFREVEFIFEEAIGFNGIKSRVSKESVRVEGRMQGKEVCQHRF